MAITTLNNRSINRSDTASADQVWTATSATASDFQAGGGGKVLQVVTATHATIVTQTANAYVTSGLTASITPTSTSNKVAIMTGFNVETYGDGSSSSGRVAPVALFRGDTTGTNLIEQQIGLSDRTASTSTGTTGFNNVNFAYLDSPSTTSSQAYTVGISGSGATDIRAQPSSKKSSIILMEIEG